MLGEDGIVKKTIPCEQCRKDISQYAPSLHPSLAERVMVADIGLEKLCGAHFVLAGRIVQVILIDSFTHCLTAALRTGHEFGV